MENKTDMIQQSQAPKKSFLKGSKATVITEMIFSLLTISITLGYITEEYNPESDQLVLRGFLFLAFFLTAMSRFFRARRMRLAGKPRSKYMMQRAYAGVFLVCSILPFFIGYVRAPGILLSFSESEADMSTEYIGDIRQAIGILFWGVLIVGRIVSIVRDHRWRRVIPNVILILLMIVWATAAFAVCDLSGAMIASVAMTIGSIFTVVFARIHMEALVRIVRKTYALEIILGLLLLIAAFSYILAAIEESMPTFLDALWYCFAIVTTIGFGDITAVTLLGRMLSVILGIYGIIVVALITSVIVNFYGEVTKVPDIQDQQTV